MAASRAHSVQKYDLEAALEGPAADSPALQNPRQEFGLPPRDIQRTLEAVILGSNHMSNANLSSVHDDMWTFIEECPFIFMKDNTDEGVAAGEPDKIPKKKTEMSHEVRKLENLDNRARDILYQTMDKATLVKIKDCKTAEDVWETLALMCEGTELKRDDDRRESCIKDDKRKALIGEDQTQAMKESSRGFFFDNDEEYNCLMENLANEEVTSKL
ncbi:hypothetical protein OROHE_002803 [Orobanche hederae]